MEFSFKDLPVEQLEAEGKQRLQKAGCPKPFHWPLEFPEVFMQRGGFDAIVGNPPFIGGRRIRSTLGDGYFDWLTKVLFPGTSGNADLCAFFFLRDFHLLATNGCFGLLATNTIAQGDTRGVGLEKLTQLGCTIPQAVPSRKWPGSANLEVAHVWLRKGKWSGPFVLDGKTVVGISAFLSESATELATPQTLVANDDKSFQGAVVLGTGFILEPEAAQSLITNDARNKAVLRLYLNGEDVTSRPDQSASRWIINFFDWPMDRQSAPAGYSGPVASDYTHCFNIVTDRVKPERQRSNRKVYRERWWIYAERQPNCTF